MSLVRNVPSIKNQLIMRLILSLTAVLLVSFAAATTLHAEAKAPVPTSSAIEVEALASISDVEQSTGEMTLDTTTFGGVLCLVGVLLGLIIFAGVRGKGGAELEYERRDSVARALLNRAEMCTPARVGHLTLTQLRLSRT